MAQQQQQTERSSSPLAPEAAVSVLRGSFTTAGIIAVGSSAWGVSRALPALPLAVRGGINSFLFAFPFFSIREYLISPYLLNQDEWASQHPSSALHLRNVPQSAVSGAIVGGAMAAWARGPQGFVRGALTFGVLCPGIQLLLNEARVARIMLLTRSSKEVESGGAASTLPPSPDALAGSGVEVRKPEAETAGAAASHFFGAATPAANVDLKGQEVSPSPSAPLGSHKAATDDKPKPSLWSRLAAYSPVRPISDEEYQKRLHSREAELVSRLRELEAEQASLAGSGAGTGGAQHRV